MRAAASLYRRDFADLHVVVRRQVADASLTATQWTAAGRHVGAGWGASPSGAELSLSGLLLCRLDAGLIVESWWHSDLLQQLSR